MSVEYTACPALAVPLDWDNSHEQPLKRELGLLSSRPAGFFARSHCTTALEMVHPIPKPVSRARSLSKCFTPVPCAQRSCSMSFSNTKAAQMYLQGANSWITGCAARSTCWFFFSQMFVPQDAGSRLQRERRAAVCG